MGSGGNLPVGPGIWGFIAFFVLAISLWLLVRNMNSRLRRMAYRDRDEAAARAEADGAPGASGEPATPEGESDAPAQDDAAGDAPGDGDRQ
ncbi:MAG: hypothetical protein HOQ21_05145, partial [Dermatophilaceae bacterium]|nr:hypothetical protein [Dermatophilaceae bacterium]